LDSEDLEMWARQHIFEDLFHMVRIEREHVADVQVEFLARSFNALLAQADAGIMAAEEEVSAGIQGAEGRLRKAELAKATQAMTRDRRVALARQARVVHRGSVRVIGTARLETAVLSPVGRTERPQKTDQDIEAIAVQMARAYEEGDRKVDFIKSVEDANVGFDLLSLKGLERRCIEVKGRAGVGAVELTWSEYAKSVELGGDYWLYVVLDCASASARLYRVQNPAKALAGLWKTNLDVRFGAEAQAVIDAAQGDRS